MTNADNNTTIIEEDVIYEQVRNPSTLEPMIDPSTGKPRSRRVSSVALIRPMFNNVQQCSTLFSSYLY